MEIKQSPESVRNADWKILIIDDDEDDFLIVREMLTEAKGRKYDVQWAPTYEAGQAALLAEPFTAVLVDYDLGLHSGIELIREASARGYPSPLILFTGRGSYEVDVEAMEAGATLYLTKNEANPLLLERVIRYAVERKQTETELRKNSEALRQNQDRFRAALASAPISVYTTDCDLRLTWMHTNYREFDAERVIGLRLDQVVPGAYGSQLVAIQQEVIETGQARQGEIETLVEGQQYVYTYYIDPIRDEKGEIAGVACAGYEITAHKQAEAALQRSMEREHARAAELETLMDTVPAVIWIARDAECRAMTGNRYGYEFLRMWQGANISKTASIEELSRQPYRNFKNGREIPIEELPMQIAAATGQPASNIDFDLVFDDGTVRTILGNVNPLFDPNGKPSGAVAAFIDITDRHQVEERLEHYARELERSNQALQDFAFTASHDLQEPLRKIIMFGGSLRSQMKDKLDETAIDYLNRIQNAAERMQTMINGLLELSRVNTRGAEFIPVQLTGLVEEVISDMDAQIEAVDGQVQVEALPSLEADALQMRQLFQNLIGNAIKFHRPGVPPRIRINGRVRTKNKTLGDRNSPMACCSPMVEIRVEDNGIGFEQQYAAHIFQPFQRLHGRSEYEGTGLGLAICQKIVERHHGKIEVQSTPGEGTTFIIQIPVKAG